MILKVCPNQSQADAYISCCSHVFGFSDPKAQLRIAILRKIVLSSLQDSVPW